MSGIAGIFSRRGRPIDPVDRRLVGSMMAAASHRGPDGSRVWHDQEAVLGHQLLSVLPDDATDGPQPYADAADGIAITFDGRIDNRQDLVRALDDRALRNRSDAVLVLAAYRTWGEACPAHLVGDFAFAIRDRRRRAVFCARDVLGVKPFCYYLDADRFVWGSEVGQVLAAGVPRRPNEGMVAEHLAHAITSRSDTLFEDVRRLPPAHHLTVTPDRVSLVRYWQADLSASIEYRCDADYAERFRELFDEAVRCRLRAAAPVGAHLSGGLDSSSVVSTMAAIAAPPVTFSLVYPHMPSADETAYIDAVTDRWSLLGRKVEAGSRFDGAACRARVSRRQDAFDLPADYDGDRLLAAMRDRGMHVALTGAGGDYGLAGSPYRYADLLRAGDLAGLIRQVRADRCHPDHAWSAAQVLSCGLRPLVPLSWRDRMRPLARRMGWIDDAPAWIPPGFAGRVALSDRLRLPGADRRVGAFSRRDIWACYESGWSSRILETAERASAEAGIDARHPFFDRRLVEFVLAIPESQRCRGQVTKYVLRRAMGHRLPDRVYHRLDKADFSPVVPRAVEAVGGVSLFEDLAIARLGWVDRAGVVELHQRARRLHAEGGEGYCPLMFRLWMIAGIELWYRAAFLERVEHGRATDAGFDGHWPWREGGQGRAGVPAAAAH